MSFLGMESALVDRLKFVLPHSVHVLTAADLSGVSEGSQPTPAVHVVYGGGEIKRLTPDGRAAQMMQRWHVVVSVRNVHQVRSGGVAREDASALADAVLGALMGWRTNAASAPIMATTPLAPAYSAGFFYLPLSFTAEVILNNPPQ